MYINRIYCFLRYSMTKTKAKKTWKPKNLRSVKRTHNKGNTSFCELSFFFGLLSQNILYIDCFSSSYFYWKNGTTFTGRDIYLVICKIGSRRPEAKNFFSVSFLSDLVVSCLLRKAFLRKQYFFYSLSLWFFTIVV